MSDDDRLFEAIGDRLGRRPGWRLESSPTPGGPMSWCFEEHGRVLLSVTVTAGTISAYLPDGDVEVEFADLEALVAWVSLAGWTRVRP